MGNLKAKDILVGRKSKEHVQRFHVNKKRGGDGQPVKNAILRKAVAQPNTAMPGNKAPGHVSSKAAALRAHPIPLPSGLRQTSQSEMDDDDVYGNEGLGLVAMNDEAQEGDAVIPFDREGEDWLRQVRANKKDAANGQ